MSDLKPCPATATWTVSLDSECPGCHEMVDLLDVPDFWDGRQLDIAEHGTKRSRGVPVECPRCHHEWKVDLLW